MARTNGRIAMVFVGSDTHVLNYDCRKISEFSDIKKERFLNAIYKMDSKFLLRLVNQCLYCCRLSGSHASEL